MEDWDEDFFTAIRNYLNDSTLAYSYARTEDLIHHVELQTGEPVGSFFEDWFYGEGYPTYQISWNQENDTLHLNISQNTSHSSVDFYAMPLEIQILSEGQDSIVRLEHLFSGQDFQIPFESPVKRVVFDPNYRMISGLNLVTNAEELIDFTFQTTLFPNPGQDRIVVEWKEINWQTVEIRDLQGKLIWNSSTVRSPLQISLDHIAEGVYFIAFKNQVHSLTKKLIIQK